MKLDNRLYPFPFPNLVKLLVILLSFIAPRMETQPTVDPCIPLDLLKVFN
jgi:hypothetical protein